MSNVALIVVYNHSHIENIDRIEEIYKGRFKHIYHLMPFYTGRKKNVIPVYAASYYFQAFVNQSFEKLIKEKFEYYFYVADDMFLNPKIDEYNYKQIFKLDGDTCFIPEFIELHKLNKFWMRCMEALNFRTNTHEVKVHEFLPSFEEAIKKLSKYNLEIGALNCNQIWPAHQINNHIETLSEDEKSSFLQRKYDLPYPLIGSYSDIFIINHNTLELFSHYCGVFAAAKLFVELSIPTALIFSAENIVTEEKLDYKGKPLWTNEDYKILQKFENRIDNLNKNFPDEHIYLHPIKLSKWN